MKFPNMNLFFVLLGALASPTLAALELVPGATWTAVSRSLITRILQVLRCNTPTLSYSQMGSIYKPMVPDSSKKMEFIT
jgi:hypothetical protein